MKTYDENGVLISKEDEYRDKAEYEDFLKKMVNPKKIKDRIAQDIEGLEEFDYVASSNSDEGFLEGYREKRFVMLDSSYFQEYIDAAQSEDSKNHYITYLSAEDLKKGIFPKKFSALVKDNGTYIEEFVPRILNFFGVNTVFNKAIEANNETFLVSLDCIKPNTRIYPVCIEHCFYDEDQAELEEILKEFDNELEKLISSIKDGCRVQNVFCDVEQLKKEYLKSYLVRYLILDDVDFFGGRNFGFLYNELENKIDCSLNFDFECALSMSRGFSELDMRENFKNILFIKEKYPEVYFDVKSRLEEFTWLDKQSGLRVYEKLIFKSLPPSFLEINQIFKNLNQENSQQLPYFKRIKRRIDIFEEFANQFENVNKK